MASQVTGNPGKAGRHPQLPEYREPQTATLDSVVTEQIAVDDQKAEEVIGGLLGPVPTTEIVIGGKNVGCILDTGSETSLISSSFFHEHLPGLEEQSGPVGSYIKLVGVADVEVPVEGYFRSKICLFGVELEAAFLIKRDHGPLSGRRRQFPVIIGCNILEKLPLSVAKLSPEANFVATVMSKGYQSKFQSVSGLQCDVYSSETPVLAPRFIHVLNSHLGGCDRLVGASALAPRSVEVSHCQLSGQREQLDSLLQVEPASAPDCASTANEVCDFTGRSGCSSAENMTTDSELLQFFRPTGESPSLSTKENIALEGKKSNASVAIASSALNTEDSWDRPSNQGGNTGCVDIVESVLCVKASSELAREVYISPDRTVASLNHLVADGLQKAGKPARSCVWNSSRADQSSRDTKDHVVYACDQGRGSYPDIFQTQLQRIHSGHGLLCK